MEDRTVCLNQSPELNAPNILQKRAKYIHGALW